MNNNEICLSWLPGFPVTLGLMSNFFSSFSVYLKGSCGLKKVTQFDPVQYFISARDFWVISSSDFDTLARSY